MFHLRNLTNALVAWGPAGILLLAVLDSSGVPVAGVFDSLLVGVAMARPEAAWVCAALAVAGSMAGNIILYWTARRGGRRFMDSAAPEGSGAKFRSWFHRYGMITVFVPALIPIPLPLKVFVISAGATRAAFPRFIAVILMARFIRYFGEAWLGVRLRMEPIAFMKSHAWEFGAGAVLLFAALYAYIHHRDRRARSA